MSRVKVAFFGAGSFVFGPTLLAQCVQENKISGLTWSLIDRDFESASLMAGIGRRMAEAAQVDAEFTAVRDPDAALAGADFVVCSAAVDINRRFQIDREIVSRVDSRELITEFGGVAGLMSSLRQMTLISDIAARMARVCPNAWLLDISNPLPRVCQAAHDEGVQTAGFCNVSVCGYGKLYEIFEGKQTSYPFSEAQALYDLQMGGTNHLSWLVDVRDRKTGSDLMPSLRNRLDERKASVPSKCEEYGRRTGYLLMSGDAHVQDFLPIDGLESSIDWVTHGSYEERAARLKLLSDVSEGRVSIDQLKPQPSWERPSDFIQAMVQGTDATFTSLNLVNTGQISNLPLGLFVETEASIRNRALTPDSVTLPESVLPYSLLAIEINRLIAETFHTKSLSKLVEVIDLDPTIVDKARGREAANECLAAHADVIGTYD